MNDLPNPLLLVHRLLAAIGKFLFLSPTEDDASTVANLLSALDINEILDTKKKENIIKSTKVQGLARDVSELIKINLKE
jgi:hypothetical protein